MLLKELVKKCSEKYENINISSLAFDTSEITKGALFFCLKGKHVDGHFYLKEAKEKGAVCAIVESVNENIDIPQIKVKDSRASLSEISANFFGNPEKSLVLIGITGTNGKTTTAYLIKKILEQAGIKTGLIGTNGSFAGDLRIPSKGMTTPDPVELFSTLNVMVCCGVTHVVMEVSAHALALRKTIGLCFSVAAFTNLSQDHLDYFENMESYFKAKSCLFDKNIALKNVINIDDSFGRKIYENNKSRSITYGLENPADTFAVNAECSAGGIRFVMNLCDNIINITSSLAGRFNIYNIMCAALTSYWLGVNCADIETGIRNLKCVPGRFNIISGSKYNIIIDFAHTEDGLKNVIGSVREFARGKVITVFGCGGNRDSDKRGKMGKIVSELSDFCVITSDNPRYERPEDIIDQIESGIEKNNYKKIVDRKNAIKYAIEAADDNDIVLIAGKGAERYQEINGVKYEYNDEDYIKQLIEENIVK